MPHTNKTGSCWAPKPRILVQKTSRPKAFASLLNALRSPKTSSPESRLVILILLSVDFESLYNDSKHEDSVYCSVSAATTCLGEQYQTVRWKPGQCVINETLIHHQQFSKDATNACCFTTFQLGDRFPNICQGRRLLAGGRIWHRDHAITHVILTIGSSSCSRAVQQASMTSSVSALFLSGPELHRAFCSAIGSVKALPITADKHLLGHITCITLPGPAMRTVALIPGVLGWGVTLTVDLSPLPEKRTVLTTISSRPIGIDKHLVTSSSAARYRIEGTRNNADIPRGRLSATKVDKDLPAVVLVTLPWMANSSVTRTTTGTMWYKVTMTDAELEGAPSTTFDRPMTSLMCAGHALQATWGLFCHVDQLCRLYDVEIAGNFSESTATGLTICMTRIPPAQIPVYTNSPTTTTPPYTESTTAISSSTTDPISITTADTTTSASVSTAAPSTKAPPRSVVRKKVFPTVALISDLTSVNMNDVCENEDGFLPPYLSKEQLDILFNSQESVAAWTTLVGKRCFGGDWILVWADGSRFRDDVTGYKVSAGSTVFGTQGNDSHRVCFALEGPEFVAHSCDGSTLTTSMNVVCLEPPIVFKSVNETDNASYDSQDAICRSEGGRLLPRLTGAVLKDLDYYYGNITAWTTMTGKVCQGTDWCLVWPDETRLDNETLDLPSSPGQTVFASASVNVSEDLMVCFSVENSQLLVAQPCVNSGSMSVLCSRDLSTFLSTARTINGSFSSQDALCAAEEGQAATSFNIDNLLELKYYYGSIKAWTTMVYEVSRALIGWSRKEKWYDGKGVSASKVDIPLNPSEEYKIEKTFCFVFKNTSMLVTQECFDNTTLMSALCLFV
ncbi:uncharacterized protein LOC125047550 [Penaeus chinensis]|uniref:uncharacterized protein LOC125047550 n=1 Tax=Penaeus chinensis TaxID=139456 RepID=UPI001FB6C63E|nr:uncharacterized protein LOC125047550 [Penaeus chinensis]